MVNTLEKLELVTERVSKIDDVTKYIFKYKGQNLEYVYIDNHTGKDIICTPSQTGCNLGCQFCYLTLRKDRTVQHIDADFSKEVIKSILNQKRKTTNKDILISFMGSGEPLLSLEYIKDLSLGLMKEYDNIRFGLSTIVPSIRQGMELFGMVEHCGMPLKVHYSLHHVDDEIRKKYMPNAEKIGVVLPLLWKYRHSTKNSVEVHYTLFNGNDDLETAKKLSDLLNQYDLPIKFLKFRERPDQVLVDSENNKAFINLLKSEGVNVEEYTPPGADVLSACGLFELS